MEVHREIDRRRVFLFYPTFPNSTIGPVGAGLPAAGSMLNPTAAKGSRERRHRPRFLQSFQFPFNLLNRGQAGFEIVGQGLGQLVFRNADGLVDVTQGILCRRLLNLANKLLAF